MTGFFDLVNCCLFIGCRSKLSSGHSFQMNPVPRSDAEGCWSFNFCVLGKACTFSIFEWSGYENGQTMKKVRLDQMHFGSHMTKDNDLCNHVIVPYKPSLEKCC